MLAVAFVPGGVRSVTQAIASVVARFFIALVHFYCKIDENVSQSCNKPNGQTIPCMSEYLCSEISYIS